MKVGIIQSSFIPWRGYFDFIASVDLFVFLDDVQFTRRDWRNRNRIKTESGIQWLTVPVKNTGRNTLICETQIDYSTEWRKKQERAWKVHYGACPYYSAVQQIVSEMNRVQDHTISELNQRTIKLICDYWGIRTPLVDSRDYACDGTKTEKLIAILKKAGATAYLSGPSADDYLDKKLFLKNDIRLYYKTYDYELYPQAWGEFDGAVSALDLIANVGPDSIRLLRSKSPDKQVDLS